MPERLESKPEPADSDQIDPAVIASAKLIENDAAKFLSSGSEKAANLFFDDLKDIADKGPEFTKAVFRQAAADSNAWRTLNKATVSEAGDFITFQPNIPASMFGFNNRCVSASVASGNMSIFGDVDRNIIVGLGKQREIRIKRLAKKWASEYLLKQAWQNSVDPETK